MNLMIKNITKRLLVVSVVIFCLGYISNGVMIMQVSIRSKIILEEENNNILAAVSKWKEKDDRCDYITSKYWQGPGMDVSYSGSIPFIVSAHYYFENPFDYGYLGGHGFSEMTFGIFVPLMRWRYDIYVH